MSKRDWKLFVEDMIESMELIEEYIVNMEFEDFKKDRKTVDAVVRNLGIIGEASKYIPENVKDKYQGIDWKGVVGLRNRIAHEYFGISFSIVWIIVKQELSKLKEQVNFILKNI